MAKFQMLRYLLLFMLCLCHLVISIDLDASTLSQNYYGGGSVLSVMGFDDDYDENEDNGNHYGQNHTNNGENGHHYGEPTTTTTTITADDTDTQKHSDNKIDSSDESSGEGSEFSSILRDGVGILVVVGLILLPLILIIIAACYNSQFEGSDAPNYTAIWTGFTNIADIYTDIVFTITLVWHQKWELFTYACICLAISHSISNIVGIYYIKKWNIQQVIYFIEYSPLVIIFNLLAGFRASIQILSSRLFYLDPLSMQLSFATRYRIQILLILSTILLENIPLIFIQITETLENGEMDNTTMCAFFFSLLSLVIGSLTLLSRCISTKCKFTYHFMEAKILYNITVTSSALQHHHNYCHRLFAQCLSYSLEISEGRIETVSITPIDIPSHGISCNVEILLDNDAQNIYRILENIKSDPKEFKSSLTKMLRMYGSDGNDMEISIVKLNVNHDEESQRQNRKDWQKYKPFNQETPYEQIDEIEESGITTIGINVVTNDNELQEIVTEGDNMEIKEIQIPTIELQEGDIE